MRWRAAALELGIEFEGPFTLTAPDGQRYEFAGRLPQFGAKRGMLLLEDYDAKACAAASALGFGFSCLGPEPQNPGPEPLSVYIACLQDWGWAIPGEPPSWL
jgi:hypothetical protein